MIPSFEQRHGLGARACPMGGGGGGGGSSSSNTTSNTTTNNIDRRQVVDGQGIGISGDSSGAITINASDAGAIKAGRDIALLAIDTSATSQGQLLAAAQSLFKQTADTLTANVSLAKSLAGTAQTAYADAASQAQGNKNIVLVGVAMVGLAAISMIGKK